jgi:hypothetical protein
MLYQQIDMGRRANGKNEFVSEAVIATTERSYPTFFGHFIVVLKGWARIPLSLHL